MDDLQRAYQIAAEVVKKFGDAYLPIFQRLHDEITERQKKSDIKAIALSLANNAENEK